MTIEVIAAALGILAVLGQVWNVMLNLRITSAILRSEAGLKEWVGLHYVSREVCALRHWGEEAE